MRKVAIAPIALLVFFVLSGLSCTKQVSEKKLAPEAIYIPKNLNDCFVQMEKRLKPKDIEKIKNGTEDDLANYHFTLGIWI